RAETASSDDQDLGKAFCRLSRSYKICYNKMYRMLLEKRKNMITLKSPREIEAMKESGALLADVHHHLRDFIKPGITSWDIEEFVEKFLKDHGATPEQKGFEGYKYATCVSINDEICHGFPRKEKLKDGDLIKVDMVVNLNGALSDSCWSYAVGTPSPEVAKLMD